MALFEAPLSGAKVKANDEEAEAGELVEANAHDAHYKNQEATYLECEGAESEFDGGMGGLSRHALPKKGEADLPDDAKRRKVDANEGNVFATEGNVSACGRAGNAASAVPKHAVEGRGRSPSAPDDLRPHNRRGRVCGRDLQQVRTLDRPA